MAKFVLTDASITVGNVDLSDHCSSITIESSADEVELSSFQNDYREFGQGLKDATITAEFYQDHASSSVDATLWTYNESGGTVEVVCKPTTSAVSATNPKFTMSTRLFNYNPIAGAVGEASTVEAVFRNASTTGLVRGTS